MVVAILTGLLSLAFASSNVAAPSAGRCLLEHNPLITTDRKFGQADRLEDLSCIALTLQVDDVSRRKGFSGRLVAENSCRFGVAILLSPVEVRVREAGGKALLNEHMMHAAYARLYLISSDSDLDEAFSEIDGGLSVYGVPSYVTVSTATKLEVPIRGGPSTIAGVRGGKYLALFETAAASIDTTGETATEEEPVTLEDNVAAHNESVRDEPRVFLRSRAQWISSSGPVISVRE